MKQQLYIIITLLLTSCSLGSLSPQEYVKWVNKEQGDLARKVEKGDLVYTLEYKPAAYMALKDVWQEGLTQDTYDSALTEYQGMEYFILTINTQEEKDEVLRMGLMEPNEYYERLQYYTSAVNNDLIMIDNNDTVPCVLHHFERMYKTTPYIKVLIGFDKKYEESSGAKVILRDRVYTGEDIAFNYTANDINKIPTIKF